jgi:hypothetical protein
MKNPHGHRFAADGANSVSGFGFSGVKPDPAFAMPVQVVFPFFRERIQWCPENPSPWVMALTMAS